MKTLTELTREEQARRDRADEYERLLGQQARLRDLVTKLSAQRIDVTALQKIHALAGEVPPSLITRGSLFVAGGFIVRDTLMRIAGDALAEAQRKSAETDGALTKAKTDLARVEDALSEFK